VANELEEQTEELRKQTMIANETAAHLEGMHTDLIASQAAIKQTLQQGLSGVSNQLNQGFSNVSRELGQMTAAFAFGLNQISDGLNVMAHSLNFMSDAMCKRLDALHNIANNPLLTQAQELYRMALVNYNKGFFEEALDNVKQAIEKYKTDYMSWFLLGHIYAFGQGEFSNVINLEQAIDAFTQAAKYNSPNVTASQDARLLASEIYYYWGTAQYLQSKA
jgi:tetratricopeptide (TPR) repeat protein